MGAIPREAEVDMVSVRDRASVWRPAVGPRREKNGMYWLPVTTLTLSIWMMPTRS
jgi:hypothetical protein